MTAKAWHFLRVVDGKPVLRDGKTPAPPVGEWLVHDGPVEICSSGLHASYRAIDALGHYNWTSGVACLVEVDEIVTEENDKLVCRRRRIVGMVECDNLLMVFARQQALSVIHLWDAPAIVREYLENGREEIRAAAAAATAAYAAADYADYADYAAYAAWAANAAYSANAAYAARDAASASASAARDAARDAANTALESMLLGEMGL